MTSISVKGTTKTEVDELKPSDQTYDEFVQELLGAYRRDNGPPFDVDKMVDEMVREITHRTATQAEMGAYRGAQEGVESDES